MNLFHIMTHSNVIHSRVIADFFWGFVTYLCRYKQKYWKVKIIYPQNFGSDFEGLHEILPSILLVSLTTAAWELFANELIQARVKLQTSNWTGSCHAKYLKYPIQCFTYCMYIYCVIEVFRQKVLHSHHFHTKSSEAVCLIQNSWMTKGVNCSTKLFPNCILKGAKDLQTLLLKADLFFPLNLKIHSALILITFPATENATMVKVNNPK